MLDRISQESQVANSAQADKPEPPQTIESQPPAIFQSTARRTELEFHSSMARFRILSNSAVTAQQVTPPTSNVRTDVVDAIVKSFDNTPQSFWQDRLLYVLRDGDLNLSHNEQLAVVGGLTDRMLKEDSAG